MSTPDNEREALCDTEGWYLSFFGHAPVVKMYLSPPLSDGDTPESFIALGVQGLTTLSQLAAEWARWLAAQAGETVPSVSRPDDRERRIRELAREWGGRAVVADTNEILLPNARDAEDMLRKAAAFIDALDAAEVSPKGGSGG